MAFFYNPPGDSQIYHITCELSNETVDPLSDHTFYYNIDDNNFYQLTFEEPQQEYLTFSKFQRDNLESHLKGFFLNRLTQKQINKSSNSNDTIISQPKL
ncbi:hypothetical protein GLOIN_2v1589155 [Rhizophagus irregularis DAOM 181602=DAOM 197198]|uniref:Uncharacterized protein n=1 Tax=Rhizophagus irregularis (strain DAOM 181602 / DAOM 197198 / MUCL 43194) TaxID=747089 RepID=A0A2P4Q6J1_RHIID|nr:hypothetical protein GLOIN_2v1589155 [Rhizophagus irregularis DAOM 181602=DAOM 197198]POG73222.1 hypothetical protein GLOIN_2v1589155 [Rhizophagus irregularis DAOM 181602=DAOM 197198]|eukprot:XP_025180088.1 hypothetical protein GLOIN_2v1589155 [Rhizophagus irregularis DAOM 181602=DAOM 197198]